jgi:SAM-dependent methyltransferase
VSKDGPFVNSPSHLESRHDHPRAPFEKPLHLLPANALVATSAVDHADWNFRPFLGWIERARYHLTLDLLGVGHFHRLLEIGYGSGVFFPELATRCDQLYGVDTHRRAVDVLKALLAVEVTACLAEASATALPFAAGKFDCVVAVSVLEFVEGLEQAAQEIQRVLAPAGILVMVTPGRSRLADAGLRVLTGETARADFGDRREAIIPTMLRHFQVLEKKTFPPRWMERVSTRLYTGLKLKAER